MIPELRKESAPLLHTMCPLRPQSQKLDEGSEESTTKHAPPNISSCSSGEPQHCQDVLGGVAIVGPELNWALVSLY